MIVMVLRCRLWNHLVSHQSSGRSDELRSRQFVNLVVPRFEEVGIRLVVDVHSSRQWLGINIPAFSAKFILVRPSSIMSDIESLFLEPWQKVCNFLKDALNRIVL